MPRYITEEGDYVQKKITCYIIGMRVVSFQWDRLPEHAAGKEIDGTGTSTD